LNEYENLALDALPDLPQSALLTFTWPWSQRR
jgi:hypothetical protein